MYRCAQPALAFGFRFVFKRGNIAARGLSNNAPGFGQATIFFGKSVISLLWGHF
jgi:hypothetical protein